MNQRTSLVTGASSGIGLDLTRTLLTRGDNVVALSRRANARGALEASPRLCVLDIDVADAAAVEHAAARAVELFGALDLVVNNAGIFLARPFTDYTPADLAALVATNLVGFVNVTQAALRRMAPRGSGHIVNIGTSLAQQPIAGVPSALPILIKGGIEAATRSLAIEYAARGVRVNTVAAGIIDTPLHAGGDKRALATLSPAQRIGRAEEISAAVLYLDSAEFVSGEILHVDGGAHAGKW